MEKDRAYDAGLHRGPMDKARGRAEGSGRSTVPIETALYLFITHLGKCRMQGQAAEKAFMYV